MIETIPKLSNIDRQKCREDAVQRFDYRIMTNNYLDAYNKVLSGK